MKKIGIVVKKDRHAGTVADQFEKWLKHRNIEVVRRNIQFIAPGLSSKNGSAGPSENSGAEEAPKDLDAVFVLGGDGTFLSAARWIGHQDIPVIGVKFGDVGFLAETVEDNLFVTAESVLSGNFKIETRMRIAATVTRNNRVRFSETALNDIVITKGALSRLAHMITSIDGKYLTTFSADGLIIATPTGSTAYSLAAGGPVMHPFVPGIIMTPICPFTLTNRPVILPDSAEIMIELEKESSDIILTIDGQEGFEIDSKDIITVRNTHAPVHMITLPGRNYFDILKTKLMWSGGRT